LGVVTLRVGYAPCGGKGDEQTEAQNEGETAFEDAFHGVTSSFFVWDFMVHGDTIRKGYTLLI